MSKYNQNSRIVLLVLLRIAHRRGIDTKQMAKLTGVCRRTAQRDVRSVEIVEYQLADWITKLDAERKTSKFVIKPVTKNVINKYQCSVEGCIFREI